MSKLLDEKNDKLTKLVTALKELASVLESAQFKGKYTEKTPKWGQMVSRSSRTKMSAEISHFS